MKSVHTFVWNEPLQFSEKVAFAEFWWKDHNFLNMQTGELGPTISLFNYWNDLVLGSEETCFLEVGAYVRLKRATGGVRKCRFCWIWVKIPQFFENKNVRVGPKDFTVWLLKWCCLRLSRNVFYGSQSIRVSGTGHHSSLRVSFLLNLAENITFLKNIKTEEWDLKNLLFNCWNDLVLGSVEIYFLEVGAFLSL